MTPATNPGGAQQSKTCCAPSAGRESADPIPEPMRRPDPAHTLPTDDKVSLPGGKFLMGTDYRGGFPGDGEGPVRRVSLRSFTLDRAPVTNQRFAAFVDATGYRTEAEVFGWSFVFYKHIPAQLYPRLVVDTVAAAPWWCKVAGARWNHPEGEWSNVSDRADHPVVHVSWNDAQAFCRWEQSRLPTEAEWEYAARAGLVQKLYPWGDELFPAGQHRCNIWQGVFPEEDTAEDGYAGTCPVTAFPPNVFGLYSTTGNTWEWCHDWFATQPAFPPVTLDPQGPESGTAHVMKGGSFLCHESYCNRYRVGARSSNTADSSTSHCGFRCAR